MNIKFFIKQWQEKKILEALGEKSCQGATVMEVEYNGKILSMCLQNLIACIELYTKKGSFQEWSWNRLLNKNY